MARICLSCDTREAMTRFVGEDFTIEHAGMTARIENLSGWRCSARGEVEFDADGARRYASAGDGLLVRERRISSGA
jgi:YgiT-type zinc finger domain-containing protein